MKLHTLSRGRKKDKLSPVMIDSKNKVENYLKALRSSDLRKMHYDVSLSPDGSTKWQKNRNNKWTGYDVSGPLVVLRKAGKGNKFGA